MNLLQDRLLRMKKQVEPHLQVHWSDQEFQTVTSDDEWGIMDAQLEQNEQGSFIRRKRCYSLDYYHGLYALGELQEIAGQLAAFFPSVQLDCHMLLFFDTETTGLSSGAGNVPFMIGIGYYEPEQFVVEQLFIRNPAEERAMLVYFNHVLSRFGYIATYNGRSFDWPIMKSRYVMNRMKLVKPDISHVDFLFASRSFWRNILPSCRLNMVETQRLGFHRLDDLPGFLAPTYYFQYMSEKRVELIERIFVHNEYDILTLAALAVHFCLALQGKFDYASMKAEELVRIGLWFGKMNKPQLAEEVFAQLLQRPTIWISEHCLTIAAYYKRKGNERLAVEIWQHFLTAVKSHHIQWMSFEPLIELAMYYEHRLRDYAAALKYAEQARMRNSFIASTQLQQLQRRIDRLQWKISKNEVAY